MPSGRAAAVASGGGAPARGSGVRAAGALGGGAAGVRRVPLVVRRRLWRGVHTVARLLRASASKPRRPPLDPSETGPRHSSCDIQRHSAPQADRLPDLLPDMNGRALAEFSAALAAAELWLPVALEQISDEAAEKLSFLRVADSLVLLAALAQLRCGIN